MPPTCAPIGTPASISARLDPHVEAIDVEPFEDNTSDTTRTVYGNFSSSGNSTSTPFSANAPCPISRLEGEPIRPVSPTEYGGIA